jgi:hypothetical protein
MEPEQLGGVCMSLTDCRSFWLILNIVLKGVGKYVTLGIIKMAGAFEQVAGILKRTWECKECHLNITEDHTVAYHLVDGILYGWCESCFSQRAPLNRAAASQAA